MCSVRIYCNYLGKNVLIPLDKWISLHISVSTTSKTASIYQTYNYIFANNDVNCHLIRLDRLV